MGKYNLTSIYEGMSDEEWRAAKEADRLEDHPERDKIKAIQNMINKEKNVKEGDSIVDESEFNFFQTLAGEQYSEEEIEKYLQSDEYQEELQYSQLEMSDTDNWLNDMFEYFNKRKSLDEGLDYFARIAGLKKIK